MVCSRVLVPLMLSVIVRINAEDVVYRGTGGDGSYNEVRQSQGVIPGGESKTITTFSTRVLGDTPVSVSNLGSKVSAVPENRMFGGLDNLGLLSSSSPSLSPQLNLGLLGGQSQFSPFISGFPSAPSQFSGISQFPGISQPQQWQQPQLPLQLPQLLQQPQSLLQQPQSLLQQPQSLLQQPQSMLQQPQLMLQQPQSMLQQLQLPFQQQEQPYPYLGGLGGLNNNNYYRSPSEDQFSPFGQQ